MPMESGRLSDDLGPIVSTQGMEASKPEAMLTPNEPEASLNIDIDRNGRGVARPGSIFHARIGAGPVLGMAEHTFETGTDTPKFAAVVYDAYAAVNLGPSADDGVGSASAGFCPNVELNGQPLSLIHAAMGDRFQFQSFLDRLYFAGSTIDYKLREHNYATGETKVIDGVKGVAVAAVGNRLFVAGDPADPNLVFPSDPDDPYTFQYTLAFQIGTRTDGIVALLEHEGLLLVFGQRTASWVLPGAIDLGDLQTDVFSKKAGLIGRLALDTAEDGWVYFCDRTRGPMRWRRGMASPDFDFAQPIYEVWHTLERSGFDISNTVVKWDAAARAVRIEIQNAEVLLSWFPDQQDWTIGASTTSLAILEVRERSVLEGAQGEVRYTALLSRKDPLDSTEKLYGGDPTGHVWTWTRRSPDKVRSNLAGEAGSSFTSCLRWGNTEIAPIGYRAVIEWLLIDMLAGYEFDFTVWADMDQSGWLEVGTMSRDIGGGTLPLPLTEGDSSRLLNDRLHRIQARISHWERLIGKVVRLQMTWEGSRRHMAFVAMQMERSLENQDESDLLTPPDPSGATVAVAFLGPDGAGTSSADGTTTPGHDPGTPLGGTPTPVSFVTTGEATYDSPSNFGLVDIDNAGAMSVTLDYNFSSWTYGSRENVTNMAVAADEAGVWILTSASVNSVYLWYLMHFDTSVDPHNPTLDYEYSIYDDIGGAHSGLGRYECLGQIFYSDTTQRLYIVYHGIDAQNVGVLVLDVSSPAANPTVISNTVIQTGTFAKYRGIELSEDERYLFYGEDTSVPSNAFNIRVASISADGVTVAPYGSAFAVDSLGRPNHAIDLRRINSTEMIAAWGKSGGLGANAMAVIDITSPGSLAKKGVLDMNTAIGAGDPRPQGIAIRGDNLRAYIFLYSIGTSAGVAIVDISNTSALSLVHAFNTGATSVPGVYGGNIGFIDVAGADGFLMVRFESWDVITDELAPTLIDSGPNLPKGDVIGYASGPKTIRFGSAGVSAPTPLSANLAVVTAFGSGGRGIAVLVGLDDYTAPTVDGWVQRADLVQRDGPSGCFSNDGAYLLLVGGNLGKLVVYSVGATGLSLVSELTDSRLQGTRGLRPSYYAETVYWTVNGGNQIVQIDLADPAAPVVTATALGPTYFPTPFGLPELGPGADASQLVLNQGGPSFVSRSTLTRDGSCLPVELWNCADGVIDATNGYVWNELEGGGLAVVDITDVSLPVVGYAHFGTFNGEIGRVIKSGNYVYVSGPRHANIEIFDVTSVSAPVHLASFPLYGVVDLAMNGANELVAFGKGTSFGSFTIARINVTAPAAPVLTSSLTTSRVLTGGSVINSKAVGFGVNTATGYSLAAPPVEGNTVAISGEGRMAYGFTRSAVDYVACIGEAGLTSKIVTVTVPTTATVAVTSTTASVPNPERWGFDPATGKGLVAKTVSSGPVATMTDVDLSTPATPVLATFRTDESDRGPRCVARLGNVGFLGRAFGYGGGVLLDLSTSPVTVDGFVGEPWLAAKFPARWLAMPIRGSSIAVAVASSPTTRIYDIVTGSNPRVSQTAWTEIHAGQSQFGATSGAINDGGTKLFLGYKPPSGSWILACFDISNVSAVPAALGTVALGREVKAVRVSGTSDTVLVLHGGSGDIPKVSIYDFSTPAAPSLTGEVQLGTTPFEAYDLELY